MADYMFVNFFLRKSILDPDYGSVYVQVTVNKKRLTLRAVVSVSGFDIHRSILIASANWDNKKKRVKAIDPQAVVVNKSIVECERKLQKLYAQHEGYDIKMTAKDVKSCVCEGGKMRPTMPSLIEKFLVEKRLLHFRASTIDTYKFKTRIILEFLKHEGVMNQAAEEFTPGTLKRYRTYLITHRVNKARSADKSCQVVKTILLWAAENEHIQKNPLLYTRVWVDKTPNLECLSQEELAIVRASNLIPALRAAADCLDFACHTDLAYQNMKALTPASIQLVEGKQ